MAQLLAGHGGMKQRQAIPDPHLARARLRAAAERLARLYADWQAPEPDSARAAKAAVWPAQVDETRQASADGE